MEPSAERGPRPDDTLEHDHVATTGRPAEATTPTASDPRDPFVLCTRGDAAVVGVSAEELSWRGAPPGPRPGGNSPYGDERPRARLRFAFRFEQPYRVAALPFAVDPDHAYVEVDRPEDPHQPGTLRARFGPWSVETSLDNVEKTQVTGPYRVLKTIGPAHLSLADHGLTFATNHELGVCIRFRERVPGIEPLGVVRHPALTVTVLDVDGLRAALAGAN